MWTDDLSRLALIELWARGILVRRKGQAVAWDWLAALSWTRRTTRRDELMLVEARRPELKQLLDRVWPDWQSTIESLRELGLPIEPRGWRELEDLRIAGRIPDDLPARLNRRTATALVTEHSKATLTSGRRARLGEVEIVRDGLVRLRPPPGLTIECGDRALAMDVVVRVLGEVVVNERALRDGAILRGPRPAALLLVENVGPYMDLVPPPGWLVANVPGWDTFTMRLVLEQCGDLPVIHFGDLDPNGVAIFRHLQSFRADLAWAIPDFWSEFRDRALEKPWPEDIDGLPPFVEGLAREGLWLEQEVIVLDPRLTGALQSALTSARRTAGGTP